MPEDGTASITVTVGGTVLLDVGVQRDCEQPTPDPEVELVPVCADGAAELHLTNTGDADITVTVTADGSAIATDVLVPAGTTAADPVVLTHAMTEDQTVVFRATGPDYDSGDQPFTLDCSTPTPDPEVELVPVCADGAAELHLTNTGDADITVTVTADGSAIATDVLVPAGTTAADPVVLTHAMTEDQTVVFRATGPDYDSGDQPFTLDCHTPARPLMGLRDPCVATGVAFDFTNVGGVDESVTVTRDGVVIDTFTLPAGTTDTDPVIRTFAMDEDSIAVYRATGAGGFDSGDLQIVRNCLSTTTTTTTTTPTTPTTVSVLGTRVTRPAATTPLARTGSDVRPWLALGIGLIGAGVMLIGAAGPGTAAHRRLRYG